MADSRTEAGNEPELTYKMQNYKILEKHIRENLPEVRLDKKF